MNKLELIEKLRERADISYEEADKLLETTQGDLVAALILLEKQGRVNGPQYTNGYADNTQGSRNVDPAAQVPKQRRNVIGHAFRTAGSFLAHTTFHIGHDGNDIFMMPTYIFAILMLFFWETIVPVMLVSLLFNVRFYFDGSEKAKAANRYIDRAEVAVEEVWNYPCTASNESGSGENHQPSSADQLPQAFDA